MSPLAVTDGASAAPDRHADILPADKNYRLTGELPTADTEEAPAASPESEPKPGAPAAPDSETAAASEAAPPQEQKGPDRTKTPQASESRWAKLSRENRELRDRLARLEGAHSAKEEPRETKQASQPAADKHPARPQPGDVDEKGQPKYKDWSAYEDARDQWLRDEVRREFEQQTARTAQEQAERVVNEGMARKFATAREKYSDFDAVALNPDLILPKGSVADAFLLDSEHPGEVAYYLGQHPEILQGFYANYDPATGKFQNLTTPQRQFRKLMEIEAEVSGGTAKPAPAKPVTQAPRPPNQVSGKGTVAKDAIDRAVEENDADAFMRERNARDPRVQAVLAARKGK